jgi:hypothetical protein
MLTIVGCAWLGQGDVTSLLGMLQLLCLGEGRSWRLISEVSPCLDARSFDGTMQYDFSNGGDAPYG